jgi:predicted MFS family arabinose efflux permease
MSYFAVFGTTAVAFAPLIGFSLIQEDSFLPVWLVASTVLAVAIFVVLTIRNDNNNDSLRISDKKTHHKNLFWRFFEKSAIKPSLIFLVMFFTNAGALIFLPIYAFEKGIVNLGLFYLLQGGASFVSNIFVGKMISRLKSPLFLLLLAVACYIGAFFSWFTAEGSLSFAIAAILFGFAFGTSMTTISAVTMSSAPPERRGAASSTFQLAMDTGFAIGSLVWGIVAGIIGFQQLYGVIVFIPLVAGAMSILFYRKSN